MKIIKQNAQLLDTTNMTQYQVIERVGRTCYKSEDKITDDSARKFVASLVKSGHHAMIEFGFIYLKLTEIDFHEWFVTNKPSFIRNVDNYVVGNMRAFYDWYKDLLDGKWFFGPDADQDGFLDLLQTLSMAYPEGSKDLYDKIPEKVELAFDDSDCPDLKEVNYPFRLMRAEEFYADYEQSGCIPNLLKYITPHIVMFRTNRGVSHELVRHRPCSFAMESTRYCNYGKKKFGGELTVIEPCLSDVGDTGSIRARNFIWEVGMEEAEKNYLRLLEFGATPEQARDVLPHAIKADIWMCAFEDEWEHILNLRMRGTTGAPHPQIKQLMEIAYPQLVTASNDRLLAKQNKEEN